MTMSGSDVVALLRTRQYLVLLVFAAVLGATDRGGGVLVSGPGGRVAEMAFQSRLPSESAGLSRRADLVATAHGRGWAACWWGWPSSICPDGAATHRPTDSRWLEHRHPFSCPGWRWPPWPAWPSAPSSAQKHP